MLGVINPTSNNARWWWHSVMWFYGLVYSGTLQMISACLYHLTSTCQIWNSASNPSWREEDLLQFNCPGPWVLANVTDDNRDEVDDDSYDDFDDDNHNDETCHWNSVICSRDRFIFIVCRLELVLSYVEKVPWKKVELAQRTESLCLVLTNLCMRTSLPTSTRMLKKELIGY